MEKAKRRFEYKDEKSNKYWEIELDGKSYTTYYAKIGKEPQSDINTYDSEEEAEKEYEKKVKSKVKKGYIEVEGENESESDQFENSPGEKISGKHLDLPEELEEYRGNIEATIKPFIKMTSHPEKGGGKLWQSKFGGDFYMPKDYEYDFDFVDFYFLLQINFEELPDDLGILPKKGLLQIFYIDDNWPPDWSEKNQGIYRVVFFEDIVKDESKLTTDFSFLPEYEWNFIKKPSSLIFEKQLAPISKDDYRSKEKIGDLNEIRREDKKGEAAIDKYTEICMDFEHKIGGYPMFINGEDPRSHKNFKDEGYVQFLQLDDDSERSGMGWGDGGNAHFFIKPEDLKNAKFDDMLFDWNCF